MILSQMYKCCVFLCVIVIGKAGLSQDANTIQYKKTSQLLEFTASGQC